MNVHYAWCALVLQSTHCIARCALCTSCTAFRESRRKQTKKLYMNLPRKKKCELQMNALRAHEHKSIFDTKDKRRDALHGAIVSVQFGNLKEFAYSQQTHRNWNFEQKVKFKQKLCSVSVQIWCSLYFKPHFAFQKCQTCSRSVKWRKRDGERAKESAVSLSSKRKLH